MKTWWVVLAAALVVAACSGVESVEVQAVGDASPPVPDTAPLPATETTAPFVVNEGDLADAALGAMSGTHRFTMATSSVGSDGPGTELVEYGSLDEPFTDGVRHEGDRYLAMRGGPIGATYFAAFLDPEFEAAARRDSEYDPDGFDAYWDAMSDWATEMLAWHQEERRVDGVSYVRWSPMPQPLGAPPGSSVDVVAGAFPAWVRVDPSELGEALAEVVLTSFADADGLLRAAAVADVDAVGTDALGRRLAGAVHQPIEELYFPPEVAAALQSEGSESEELTIQLEGWIDDAGRLVRVEVVFASVEWPELTRTARLELFDHDDPSIEPIVAPTDLADISDELARLDTPFPELTTTAPVVTAPAGPTTSILD